MNPATEQAEANTLTLDGIALLEQRRWADALEKFDAAIAIRENLPWQQDPAIAWGLAASWLNRADALYHSSRTADSLPSLDRAIEVMDALPLAEHPAYVDRLLLAWINRGTRAGELGEAELAGASFAHAGRLLETWRADTHDARRMLAAMFHGNRARLRLAQDQTQAALADARAAIAALKGLPEAQADVARMAVTSRSVLCRALAKLLDIPGGIALSSDWIAEATDAAEEALALVKQHGLVDALAADLVRYGAIIYRKCQPHFLAEFLRDGMRTPAMRADSALCSDMRNLLIAARADAEARVIAAAHDEAIIAKESAIIQGFMSMEASLDV